MRGTYAKVPGAAITADCDTQGKGFSELVTTMFVIRWEMVGCGTATAGACS